MTRQPIADRVAGTLASMRVGLDLVEAFRSTSGSELSFVDDIDLVQIRTSIPISSVGPLVSTIESAAAAGHRTTVIVTVDGSDLTSAWTPRSGATVDLVGDAGDLTGQRDVDALVRATKRADAVAALGLLSAPTATVEVTLKTPESRVHWLRTAEALVARLSDHRWASTLTRLTIEAAHEPSVVIVNDAGAASITTPALLVIGPMADLPSPPRTATDTEKYESRAGFNPRPRIPPPNDLQFLVDDDDALSSLRESLRRASRASCWYWLADSVEVTAAYVSAHFDGVATLDLDLLPYADVSTMPELELASWALDTGEASRAETVQRAVTFAVRSASDLPGAAGPVLRTAQSFYELAGRALVTEALTARRAARENAFAAGRAAATSARDAATKSIERALTLLIAAAVAVFANGRKFIDSGTSYTIIVTLAAVAIAALLVAWLVDLRSATSVLDAFEEDIEQFRDTLSAADIESAKKVKAIAEARVDVCRAKWTTASVYGTIAAAVLVGGGLLIYANRGADLSSPAAPEPTGYTAPVAPPSTSKSP